VSGKNNKHRSVIPIYVFAGSWLILSFIFPLYRIWGLLLATAFSACAAYTASSLVKKRSGQDTVADEPVAEDPPKYSPEVEAILAEGRRAMGEMGRLYMSIKDPQVREKINEIMRITDKITQDAIEDPDDIPQIKKFLNYYLPTTIKLLNAYDRMSSQGIEGENLGKSMKNINEMLDAAVIAYKKRLDSLFANQALDIETDIEVMNTMLAREGLTGNKDFNINS